MLDAGGVVSFALGFSEVSADDESQHGKTLQDEIIGVAGQMPVLDQNVMFLLIIWIMRLSGRINMEEKRFKVGWRS